MITIYEVAKEANVAPKTAARILAGEKGRPYNRERVMAAAKKLGYVRNQQAANLRSGRSALIGVIVPDISNPFYPVFFQTIHDLAVDVGYQILLSSTFGKSREEIQALQMFEVNRVEGIILNAAEGEPDSEADAVIERFTKRGVPIILAGRPARNLQADEIVIRNVEGVEKAVQYLIRIGHQHIGFVSGSEHNLGLVERRTGWEQALRAKGLPVDARYVSGGEASPESGWEQARRLFRLTPRPTAIMAANDMLAFGVLKAAHEAGLRVPEDVAVIGFDDIRMASFVNPALTTLRQPQEKIAREAMNLLLARIRREDTSPPRRLVYDVELILRESA